MCARTDIVFFSISEVSKGTVSLTQDVGKVTGANFNLLGHSLENVNIAKRDQKRNNNALVRRQREKYFETIYYTFNKVFNLRKKAAVLNILTH